MAPPSALTYAALRVAYPKEGVLRQIRQQNTAAAFEGRMRYTDAVVMAPPAFSWGGTNLVFYISSKMFGAAAAAAAARGSIMLQTKITTKCSGSAVRKVGYLTPKQLGRNVSSAAKVFSAPKGNKSPASLPPLPLSPLPHCGAHTSSDLTDTQIRTVGTPPPPDSLYNTSANGQPARAFRTL